MRPTVVLLELSLETDIALATRNPTWEPEVLLHAWPGSEELMLELDTSSSEVKETSTALHAAGNIPDTQPQELDIKTPESSPMRLSDGNSMRPMVVRLRLLPETDTALVTESPT
jgi:hypothetical protein